MARTRPRTDPTVEVAGILPTQRRETTTAPRSGPTRSGLAERHALVLAAFHDIGGMAKKHGRLRVIPKPGFQWTQGGRLTGRGTRTWDRFGQWLRRDRGRPG